MIKNIKEFNQLEEQYSNGKMNLLYFYTKWCISCRTITTFLEKQIPSNASRWNFFLIDCDESEILTQKFQVQVVPTIVFTNSNFETVQRVIGQKTKNIKQCLAKDFHQKAQCLQASNGKFAQKVQETMK